MYHCCSDIAMLSGFFGGAEFHFPKWELPQKNS